MHYHNNNPIKADDQIIFFSEFQKRVLGLLLEIKELVTRVGQAQEPAESTFAEELDTVEKLQEFESSLEDVEKRQKMVTTFF